MTAQVGRYAANALLKKHMKNYQGKKVETGNDPYFAMVEDPKRPGKYKKVKKQVPAYIPEHDANVLATVRRRAYRLDMCLFSFLGIRFGWEAVIGLIPLAGDAVGVFFALMVVQKCMQVEGGLSSTVKLRMLINIAIDFTVGLVPFIGDLADAAFKCNTKNLRLLEVVLDKRYKPGRDERDLVGVDKEQRRRNRASGIYMRHDPPPATAFEDFSDEEEERLQFMREQQAAQQPRQPPTTRTADGRKGGWFGSKNKPSARPTQDVEMAQAPPRQETGTVRR